MAQLPLYLTGLVTQSPFPVTSRRLSASPGGSEQTLGPGFFNSGAPGGTDLGQWNPSTPIADGVQSAEGDNTGGALGTARQGWLYPEDLAGTLISAGTWTLQLRLAAPVGTGLAGRVAMRATVVTGVGGAWVTQKILTILRITGTTTWTAGQVGWRDCEARISPVTAAANYRVSVASVVAHTFQAGERLLVELGFSDGDSVTSRVWSLLYNNSSSYILPPEIHPQSALNFGTNC